jgi:hypothetical protein
MTSNLEKTYTSAPQDAILGDEEHAMLVAYVKEQMNQGQVPFDLAAHETGLDPLVLRKLVRDGVLPGVAPYRVPALVGTCDLVAARRLAEQLHAARKPVEGNGILATECAEKYDFSRNVIYLWLKHGWVKQQGTAPNGDLLVNEGDIAFARALADMTGQQNSKPVFPKKTQQNR